MPIIISKIQQHTGANKIQKRTRNKRCKHLKERYKIVVKCR